MVACRHGHELPESLGENVLNFPSHLRCPECRKNIEAHREMSRQQELLRIQAYRRIGTEPHPAAGIVDDMGGIALG